MAKRQSESLNEAIVIAVLKGGMSTKVAGEQFGVSQRWVRALVRRARLEGMEAVRKKSRRPHTNPRATAQEVRDRIVFLRNELTRAGLDAGPESIWDRLDEPRPHPTTIYRILKASGKVENNPRKRPKRTYIRFQAALPNEMWQSDVTHVRLKDGSDVEVISWIDDHSRYALHLSAHQRVTVPIVVATFTTATREYGYPQATLTDNGAVYTAKYAAGAKDGTNQLNMFEKLLHDLNITQKNGLPGRPTTQGKVERFQSTMKQWLNARPPAKDLTELNAYLTQFQTLYNTIRPHRSLNRRTPHTAYTALPAAEPTMEFNGQPWRVRHDTIDTSGVVTYRYAGRLKHLGIGRAHHGKQVIIFAHGPSTMIIDRTNGDILAEHLIDPNKDYQRKIRG